MKSVSSPNAALGARESGWSATVGRAARVLFWTELASVLFANLLGFVVTLVTQSTGAMKWIAFVPAAASIVMMVATFGITGCNSEQAQRGGPGRLRRPLRFAAVLGTVVQCGATLSMLTVDVTETLPIALLREVVSVVFLCMLFAYLSGLTRRYADRGVARWLGVVAWGYAVTGVVSVLVHVGTATGDVPFNMQLYLWNGLAFLVLGIEVLGLVGLWRFGTRFPRIASGRCLKCGYLLRGLADLRCPECGEVFDTRVAG